MQDTLGVCAPRKAFCLLIGGCNGVKRRKEEKREALLA